MDLVLIKKDSPEWEYMWQWLADNPLNSDLSDPRTAANKDIIWRYNGSYGQGKRVIHHFRHECHPTLNEPKDLYVSASEKITDNDIEKRILMK